jgi:hypothetical protein
MAIAETATAGGLVRRYNVAGVTEVEAPMSRWRLLVVLPIVLVGLVSSRDRVSAAPETNRIEFEDAWVRVRSISVAPGETSTALTQSNGVLVYLTADLEGRMPRSEAVWHAAGSPALQNRAATRFDAMFVELKASPSSGPAPSVPELMPADTRYDSYLREHRAAALVENDRVTVSRHRVVPYAWTQDYHTHPREAVVIYLRGGDMSGTSARPGYHRVRRGGFDVLPADLFHTLYNGGTDPIDFVAVWPK